MRNFLLFLHRWVGIILAIYIFVIGVTGSILVFHDEAAAVFRQPRVENGSEPFISADTVIDNLHQAYPGWHLHRLYWPENAQSPWMAEVLKGDVGFLGETAFAVYLHPNTGKILHVHDYGRSIWRVLQVVHINLLSGRSGRTFNGSLALAVLFSILTGAVMWLSPAGRGNKPLWKVNWSARPRRLNWEIHQVAGIFLFAFMSMFCITGSYFAWSSQYVRAIAAIFPMNFMNQRLQSIEPVAEADLRPVSSFLSSVHEQAPGYAVTQVIFPEGPAGPIRFVVHEGSRDQFYKASNLFYNPATGELLRADLVRNRASGDSIVNWISAVHIGAFGKVASVIWALAGLGFPLSAITGVIIYVNKRNRKLAWKPQDEGLKADLIR